MDDSGTRITSGTFGLWAFNGGSKYWDDLAVESLSVAQPTPTPTSTVEATATPTNTPIPPTGTSYTTTQRVTLSLAGQRIAVRTIVKDDSNAVIETSTHYFLTDHLGSTSQMVNHVGNVYVGGSNARHTPFGDYRTTPTADNTDMGFTGHRENRDIGLTYMNARFYVSGIGRFASADTIVPNPTNPQAFNRYAYVENQPIRYNDPTGHCGADTTDNGEFDPVKYRHCDRLRGELEESYGVEITGYWTLVEMGLLRDSFADLDSGMGEEGRAIIAGITISRLEKNPEWERLEAEYRPHHLSGNGTIFLYDGTFSDTEESAWWTILHEIGHRYDHTMKWGGSTHIWTEISDEEPCKGNYCDPVPISPYDAAEKKNTETFAQAFALTYFTGDIGNVKEFLRPTTDIASGEQLERARDYILSLQVTD
ncbi:MAG: RHS repeat-associated core domain-containing protein [Chloroflexota bacterium]